VTINRDAINPGIYNSRQNISLAIRAKRGDRFNKLLGCTVDDFRWHIERQFRDGMTWDGYGLSWCVDHTVPCCSFPADDPDAKYECHHWSNLCPVFIDECRDKKASETYTATPDYNTLKHLSPRDTIIGPDGIPIPIGYEPITP